MNKEIIKNTHIPHQNISIPNPQTTLNKETASTTFGLTRCFVYVTEYDSGRSISFI